GPQHQSGLLCVTAGGAGGTENWHMDILEAISCCRKPSEQRNRAIMRSEFSSFSSSAYMHLDQVQELGCLEFPLVEDMVASCFTPSSPTMQLGGKPDLPSLDEGFVHCRALLFSHTVSGCRFERSVLWEAVR
ncbi:hypothetical protein AAFF_G00361320, partial [Aldrovandia affinis]